MADLEDAILKNVRDDEYAANTASAVASDLGSRAFKTHVGYPAAISANKKAAAAWSKVAADARVAQAFPMFSVVAQGAKDLAVDYEKDANDRVGELNVARQALQDDMRQNLHLVLRPSEPAPQRYHMTSDGRLVAGPDPSDPGGAPSGKGSGLPTWALVAGAVVVVGGGVVLLTR